MVLVEHHTGDFCIEGDNVECYRAVSNFARPNGLNFVPMRGVDFVVNSCAQSDRPRIQFQINFGRREYLQGTDASSVPRFVSRKVWVIDEVVI